MKRLMSLCLCLLLVFSAAAEELDFLGFEKEEKYSDEEIMELLYHTREKSGLPDETLDDEHKTVTILTHYSLKKYIDIFEEMFDAEVVQIICGVQEYSSKLQSLVAAGTVPDLVVSESSTNPCFVTLANAGLVQPFDDYIDYNEPELRELKPFYDAGLWHDQHYLAPFDNKPLYYLIYDRNIFAENGLPTPWERWEAGDWTWDTFREYVLKLNIVDNDGNYVCYGTTAMPYGVFSGSTGVDYIQLGNGTIDINLNDPAITRAENFTNDLFHKDGVIKVKAQNSWSGYLTRGMLAMQIVDSYLLDGSGEIAAAIQQGRLGLCPLPQDPQYNVPGEYHTYSQSGGFCLVAGAPNPEGAALFIRTICYSLRYGIPGEELTNEEKLAALHEKGWDNELLYQKQACRAPEHTVISFGYGFIAQHKIWMFMALQNNWTSFVEGILPGAEEAVREMLEG